MYKSKNPGNGSKTRGDGRGEYGCMKRIMTAFPDDTFDEIRKRAVKEGTSFAEQVRLLVEWGLEADCSVDPNDRLRARK